MVTGAMAAGSVRSRAASIQSFIGKISSCWPDIFEWSVRSFGGLRHFLVDRFQVRRHEAIELLMIRTAGQHVGRDTQPVVVGLVGVRGQGREGGSHLE